MNQSRRTIEAASASDGNSGRDASGSGSGRMSRKMADGSLTSGGQQPPGQTRVGDGDHSFDLLLLVPAAIAGVLVLLGQWLAAPPVYFLPVYACAVGIGLGVALVILHRARMSKRHSS